MGRYNVHSGGHCEHGHPNCTGNPDQGVAPCAPSDHHYCAHGTDARLSTKDGEPRCPYCRGVTRHMRNPDTFRRWRDTQQPALAKDEAR